LKRIIGIYHREPLQHRNIGLIGSTTTAAVAMPRHNYNSGLHPYKNVIIPMSPYYWSPLKSGLLHRDNDYYRGRGSVSVLERRKQQLFGGLIPKKTTRKIVIGGPGGHVSQSFIGPNTHYGTAAFTVKHWRAAAFWIRISYTFLIQYHRQSLIRIIWGGLYMYIQNSCISYFIWHRFFIRLPIFFEYC